MSSNIKHFLKDIGMAYQEFPTQIILQLLKHSEINKRVRRKPFKTPILDRKGVQIVVEVREQK
jgi:hypothetical protein